MLIYNNKREFIGIDADDLETLGFSNLEELKEQYADFADMFAKEPGYVQNFKHIDWIDYIECADSSESTRVLIDANNKRFHARLEVKVIYLTQEPNSKAYLVYLNHLRESIDGAEDELISFTTDTSPKTTPKEIETVQSKKEEIVPEKIAPTVPSYEEAIPTEEPSPIITPEITETKPESDFKISIESEPAEEQPSFESKTHLDDVIKIDDDFKIDLEETSSPEIQKEKIEIPVPQEPKPQAKPILREITVEEIYNNGYTYDPHVASDELGLPVDLIEEFIEDFVAQAREFHHEIYAALNDGEHDKVKSLSHKLKGVAANLRIEDALEHLVVVNTSDNIAEVKENLDTFYKVISKLAGEKILVTKSVEQQEAELEKEKNLELEKEAASNEADDDLDIDLDIFAFPIEEPKTPESIEVPTSSQVPVTEDNLEIRVEAPELVDDTFAPVENIQVEETPLNINVEENHSINYDPNLIASEIGLNKEQFMDLFKDYITEIEGMSKQIESAIEEDNSILWKNKSLQIRSMCENMRVNDLSSELNILTKTDDKNEAESAYKKLSNSILLLSKLEA